MPVRRRERSSRGGTDRSYRISEAVVLISALLWIIGFASAILGVVQLPNNLGLWALALAGFIMLLASIVYGL